MSIALENHDDVELIAQLTIRTNRVEERPFLNMLRMLIDLRFGLEHLDAGRITIYRAKLSGRDYIVRLKCRTPEDANGLIWLGDELKQLPEGSLQGWAYSQLMQRRASEALQAVLEKYRDPHVFDIMEGGVEAIRSSGSRISTDLSLSGVENNVKDWITGREDHFELVAA